MKDTLIKIRDAAKMLNVSLDTLRRWDKNGTLKSIRFTPTGHRYYDPLRLILLSKNLFADAIHWISAKSPQEPESLFYCQDSAVFTTRLSKLENELQKISDLKEEFSLLTSIVGEIGNNSFDHNLGSWEDIPGIFFAYDLKKRQIVLADRGQGILTTLQRVRPTLANDEEALSVAFTEKISGRAPEARGNDLKYVKSVVTKDIQSKQVTLFFQTGDAILNLKNGDNDIHVMKSDLHFRGCLAFINF